MNMIFRLRHSKEAPKVRRSPFADPGARVFTFFATPPDVLTVRFVCFERALRAMAVISLQVVSVFPTAAGLFSNRRAVLGDMYR